MPKLLKIVTHPTPSLRERSDEVDIKKIKKNDFRELIDDMELTMTEKDGVGLAAPQIGKNIRMAIINTKDGKMCLINPEITKKSWRKDSEEEGCLSLPDIFCNIKRHKKISCRYIDRDGKKKSIEAKGFLARVIQHEIDHLDGILTIDREKMQK